MNIEDIELHDALIRGGSVDYFGRQASFVLEIYLRAEDKERSLIELVFEGVEAMSEVVDFDRLEKNRFAGNVNYWVPGNGRSPTFIYLTDGLITINSATPPIVRNL